MKKIALLLFICAFSSVSAFPQNISGLILKRMDEHQKLLRTFEAYITISKSSVQSDETFIKNGSVKFFPSKTGYALRIDSVKPVAEIFSIVDDQYILYYPNPNLFYLPNTGFAYIGTVTDSQKNLLWIFSVLGNSPQEIIKRDFTVEYKGQEELNNKMAVRHLELKPKNADLYQKIDLWVDGNGMPLQSVMTETGGDQTKVLLEYMKKNERINPGLFQIKLPKNTKVIKD